LDRRGHRQSRLAPDRRRASIAQVDRDRNSLPPWLQGVQEELGRSAFSSLAELQAHVDRRVAAYNAAPQAALGGLSPNRMAELLYGDWQATGALRVNEALTLAELEPAPLLHNARMLLTALQDAGPAQATAAGNLNRRFVRAMVDAMRWREEFAADLREANRQINEEDLLDLHMVRVLLELIHLIRKRQGSFRITRAGRAALEPSQAGPLYARVFRTLFRGLNLDYLYRGWPNPAMQQTVAYTLYRLASAAEDWRATAALANHVLLPEVLEEERDQPQANEATSGWGLWGRVLRPLEWLGVIEERRVQGSEPFAYHIEVRKTALYDRVLSFRFRG